MKPGDVVHAGFRTGHLVRAKRMYGIDGWVVQFPAAHPGDGTLPHWIPSAQIKLGRYVRPGELNRALRKEL